MDRTAHLLRGPCPLPWPSEMSREDWLRGSRGRPEGAGQYDYTGLLGLGRTRTGLKTPVSTLPQEQYPFWAGCPSWQAHVRPCP